MIDTEFIGKEIAALLSVCLDVDTPEETKKILRHELTELREEIDKMLLEFS